PCVMTPLLVEPERRFEAPLRRPVVVHCKEPLSELLSGAGRTRGPGDGAGSGVTRIPQSGESNNR
ncbi:hypothetical protein NDU88_004306, partial [Pleurodeles waltl]